MFSNNQVNDRIVKDLESVLRDTYGFPGSLTKIKFSNKTEKAFTQLIKALKEQHTPPSALNVSVDSSGEDCTPRIGDSALVYWYGNGWFTATIENWLPNELSYMIRWTDGNWAPERASYNDLCVDRIPDPATIGVGTKVLFKQGLYYCGLNDDGTVCDSSGRTLSEAKKKELAEKRQISDRWHMGQVTAVSQNEQGKTVYSGRHVGEDDPQVSKNTYVGYSLTFQGLRVSQLRTLPNVFNCIDSSPSETNTSSPNPTGAERDGTSCDVFVSKVDQDDTPVRRITRQIRGKFAVSESGGETSSDAIQLTVQQIKSCSVYLVCLSDSFIENSQAMSELLYAKKTLGKTVIPVVIGKSQKWLETTAGMLLAGQLYIHFGSEDVYDEKVNELQNNLEKLVISDSIRAGEVPAAKSSGPPPRVFLSYCWSNSKSSYDSGQVNSYTGHSFSDPRKVKADIERIIGEKVWLDIEQLNSVDDSGMFGQIADGLKDSSIVVMCVSKEYTNSQNCQMEANFALRSLRKKAIVLEVGSGLPADRNDWTRSSVGMVLPTDQKPHILTADIICDSEQYNQIIGQICRRLKETALSEPMMKAGEGKCEENKDSKSSLRASVPMVGDAVVAHYAAWQFYPAKVASFDKHSMRYTVDWDDPDPSCRVQPYHLVAVNITATDDLIGIGSSILFKQGRYQFGSSTGDVWNLGRSLTLSLRVV